MSVIKTWNQSSEVQTSDVGWTTIGTLTYDFGENPTSSPYFLLSHCEFWPSVADLGISVRILIDGVEKRRMAVLPRSSAERFSFSPSGELPAWAGEHSLTFQMGVDDASQTIHVDCGFLRVDKR